MKDNGHIVEPTKTSSKKTKYKKALMTDLGQIIQQGLGERPHFVPKK